MKIAVPVTNSNQIDDHFGHCQFFSVFSTSRTGEITDVQTIKSPEGCGCKSNIADELAESGVTLMLAGGIGGGAINVLNNSGIQVVRGCSGDATEVVKLFLAGKIDDSGESCKQHENHKGEGSDHICNN
jgi:predicted Fe-Mo cluster-binding NifX family protein